MREVIDFNKNFLTGEVTEVKKYKEDTMYRGTATIQLFDKEGNIVQEAKSTNCISKAYLSMLYVNYYRNTLLYQNSNFTISYPNTKMLLTDSAVTEDPTDLLVRGNITGMADGWSTYSGSDKLLGTLNTAETSRDDWSRHIVIDFPTHAANGTFQSIYWTFGSGGNPPGASTLSFMWENYKVKAPNSQCTEWSIGVINNYIYALYRNTLTKYDMNGETINTVTLAENCIAMATSDTNLYAISNTKIYKLGEDMNLISTVSHSIPTSNYRSYLASHTAEGIFFCGYSLGEKYDFYVLDDAGNIKRKKEETWTTYWDIYGSAIDDTTVACIYGDYVVLYDAKENTVTKTPFYSHSDYNGVNIDINPYYFRFYDKKNKMFYGTGYRNAKNHGIYSGTLIPYFAHTTLPAPVTKTSANTMKIQYDFVVEPRGYFQI